ncbi:2118_t:CDS:2 [Funneliformis mosseae]|uniref:2118_t:CDS:1 n=1 Tax=Funneliformis mosseae TaxID=27381 RepID=A0A9N8VE30_FUNMO|nr:2118_t:CDS:2 [Funneliformis mosseae]
MASEINLLRQKNARLMVENTEFKAKYNVKNVKRDSENAELKAKVIKLE